METHVKAIETQAFPQAPVCTRLYHLDLCQDCGLGAAFAAGSLRELHERMSRMGSLAMTAFLDSAFGEVTELPRAGSALEHPLVFDSAARELHALADQGRLEIVDERRGSGSDGKGLIDHLRFRRLQ
ncbi:hypothetical protein SNE35_14615 [Paucibacter sp. R3-3]|uniref:Uncharacterized protein n=1 Tax=Roseateles agri TaxID=3098619 RepID=A0ABU5DHI1_9BURK|nr:hypothetical protein [Paucibacter sp. R3-3]MDY0745750.1 hypothetical protein [Paucibacter sp. R3-3]